MVHKGPGKAPWIKWECRVIRQQFPLLYVPSIAATLF